MNPPFPSKSAQNCSEAELARLAAALAAASSAGDIILLEGPMGAGKSTFARAFLQARGVSRGGEGSPTFAIAHEYRPDSGGLILHADFYRLKAEEEIDEAGITAAIWERKALALLEWTTLFPEFRMQAIEGALGRVCEVELSFGDSENLRHIRVNYGPIGAA